MEYKDFFSPKTLEKLNKKSAENLKTMLGDKTLMQTIVSSQQLLSQISKAEAPYKSQLEKLAVDMVKELYPIIDEEGIVLDAKIGDLSSVGSELDEIKVNKPGGFEQLQRNLIKLIEDDIKNYGYDDDFYKEEAIETIEDLKNATTEEKLREIIHHWVLGEKSSVQLYFDLATYKKKDNNPLLKESISPESRRRITNAITQGAALRGAFAFYLFKEHLDDIDPSLVEKYGQILKNSFGIYDDENAIAMMLAALAQGQKSAGGSSKVIINEIKVNKPGIINTLFDEWKKEEIDSGNKEVDVDKWGDLNPTQKQIYLDYVDLVNKYPNSDHSDLIFLNDQYYYYKTHGDHPQYFSNYTWNNPKQIKPVWDNIFNELNNLDEIKVNKPGFNFSNLDTIVGISKVETDVFDSDIFMELVDLGSYYTFLPYGDQPFAILIPKQFIELLPDKTADLTPDYNKLSQEDIDQLKNLIHQNKTHTSILKNNLNEATSGITIRARAINFPMLVHELIKGLYELISLQGFKGSKEERQAVVDKVDLLKNEPSDLRYGKFIYDALNNIFVNSEYNDPRIREFFFADVYQLDDDEFISFIENAINEELTSAQQKWANDTLRDISIDLKADDYDATGLDEIKINKPGKIIKLNLPSDLNKEVSIDDFDVIVKTLKQLNPHIPSKLFYGGGGIHDDILDDLGDDYVPLSKYLQIYFKWLYANLAFLKNEDNPDEFFSNEDLKTFTDNALQGKWTIFDNITDFTDYDTSGLFLDEIKIEENKSFIEKLLESFNETVKTAIENKTLDPNIYLPLKEYSEKTITTTIERWKEADPNTDENVAKQLIQRFDQIKSGLAQKLNIVVLPDELKKENNYLNIDKYSYGDMVNLIRSLPENPEKVKKDAVKKFVEKEQIDRNTAQSYVARFIANRDKIKFGAKEGLEDAGFTKEEVLNYIPKRLQRQEAFLDPRNWDWASFEQMLDALFPSQKQAKEGEENLVSTDADKIYDKDGIEIYKGDDVHKCISYNPINPETKRKKYGWCVTQIGNTNYDYYRFREVSPTFYFVFDRSKNSSPQHAPFDDQWHAFVIQVLIDNKGYIITGADNRGDIPVDSWEGISKVVPSDTWAKIKGLKDYFKPISLSAVERGRKFASGKNLSVDEFKELSQDEKILYIQGKASKNGLAPDILKILPQYKINLEGRSTTLANVAIDSRQKFPYATLKDNEALAKRYAVVSSRHYPDDPLPLPFIKYLDEDSKEKYLKKYDDNLTFEYLEKFFGDKIAEDYVNEQAKKLDYLPPAAIKYIKDPKLKQLYNVYLKLFESWRFETGTNISDEELDQIQQMPEQSVTPIPMGQKQWSDLSNPERKVIIDLVEKFNKNTNYITLIYALPYVVKNGAKKYVLVPKDNSSDFYSTWVLMDEQGKVVKDNISGEIELNGVPLEALQPDDDTGYNRVYDIKELTK